MARLKGIVAEVDGNKCVLITQDGQFLKVNKPSRAIIGEEIEVTQPSKTLLRLVPAMVAVLLLCIIIPSFSLLTAAAKPVAYLSLDINPSLDLGVDKEGYVVSVKALNPAGEKLTMSAPVNKVKVYEAVHLLIEQAIKEGFVNYTKPNLIMAAYTGGTNFTFNDNQLRSEVEAQIKAANMEAEIVVVGTDMKVHEQASSNHISQGKYSVFEAAKAKGKNLSLEDLKDDGIKNTLIAKGVQVSDLLPGVAKIEMEDGKQKAEGQASKDRGNGDRAPAAKPKAKILPGTKPGNNGDHKEIRPRVNPEPQSTGEWEHQSESENDKGHGAGDKG